MGVFERIWELRNIHSVSKHEQIVLGIIEAIDTKELGVGDKLPSINEMVEEIGFARKTIVKAYNDLKTRGLVESKNLKGYYIVSTKTNVTQKVALIMFAFHSFQEDFYNTFRKELGRRFQIDVFFHHNNSSMFETILNNSIGKYGRYVVAPIPERSSATLLKKISPERLLIVDRFLRMPDEYSYITQEFEQATYDKLQELLPSLQKFEQFILFYRDDADYPVGILKAFQKFTEDNGIKNAVYKAYNPKNLKKKTAFFFISDTYLWHVLRDAIQSKYKIGKDIGIVAHDDNIIKEISFGGITTISTDFTKMAKKAAKSIKEKRKIQEIIPSKLIKRGSL